MTDEQKYRLDAEREYYSDQLEIYKLLLKYVLVADATFIGYFLARLSGWAPKGNPEDGYLTFAVGFVLAAATFLDVYIYFNIAKAKQDVCSFIRRNK